MHARQIHARRVDSPWPRAGCEDQRVIAQLLRAIEPAALLRPVDPHGLPVKEQRDVFGGVDIRWAERQAILFPLAGPKILALRRAVIWRGAPPPPPAGFF